MSDRWERIGKNEALFRQVNERLRDVAETFSLVAEQAEFVCECGDVACTEPISMSLAEYERIRANPTWFFVRRGHEAAAVETVVERRDGYDIVAKDAGPPAALAAEEDPRRKRPV